MAVARSATGLNWNFLDGETWHWLRGDDVLLGRAAGTKRAGRFTRQQHRLKAATAQPPLAASPDGVLESCSQKRRPETGSRAAEPSWQRPYFNAYGDPQGTPHWTPHRNPALTPGAGVKTLCGLRSSSGPLACP